MSITGIGGYRRKRVAEAADNYPDGYTGADYQRACPDGALHDSGQHLRDYQHRLQAIVSNREMTNAEKVRLVHEAAKQYAGRDCSPACRGLAAGTLPETDAEVARTTPPATPERSLQSLILNAARDQTRRGCGKYKAYLRSRRRIVWNKTLTTEERIQRLEALKDDYHGYSRHRTCCEGCRSVSGAAEARVLEPADAG